MIREFFITLVHYLVDVAPALAVGLVISGLVHEFLPQKWVNRYLSKKGIVPILLATIAGIILPLCCFGSLPVAIGFKKKGVALGPVLAFLVATPATSFTAVAVTYKLLGIGFTVPQNLPKYPIGRFSVCFLLQRHLTRRLLISQDSAVRGVSTGVTSRRTCGSLTYSFIIPYIDIYVNKIINCIQPCTCACQ